MKNGKSIAFHPSQIKSSYQVLHFDEYPILFCGKNEAGEQVVGSFIQESEDQSSIEFFYAIVSPIDFEAFLSQSISYRNLLKKAHRIFWVRKSYANQILGIAELKYAEIPTDFLPLASALCPKFEECIAF